MQGISESSRNCPTLLTISAALQAFGSLLLLCFATTGDFSAKTIPIVYILLAAVGLLMAAGNFQLRKWARYSTLAFSAMFTLLPIGVIWYWVHLNSLRDPNNAADDDLMAYMAGIVFVMMVIALALAALGGFWLYYFNRGSIKRLFDASAPPPLGLDR